MTKGKDITTESHSNSLERIAEILNEASNVAREMSKAQFLAYWEIGREIVEFEQKEKTPEACGERSLQRFSADLFGKFVRGSSAENLTVMREFSLSYRKSKTLFWESEIVKSKCRGITCLVFL